MLIQISSGQGPVECEYAVGLLFASLQKGSRFKGESEECCVAGTYSH